MAIEEKNLTPILVDENGDPVAPAPVQVKPPEPAPVTKPVETPGAYNWSNKGAQNMGQYTVPDVPDYQVRGWTSAWIGRGGQAGPTNTPIVGVSLKNASQRPDVNKFLKWLGVIVQSGEHNPITPEMIDTNVQNSLYLPDGRWIQAADKNELATIVYRMIQDKGVLPDPNIAPPTQNYTPDEIGADLNAGNIVAARRKMLANVSAGNITQQQYEDFANGKKTLSDLYIETNGEIGMVNKNPTQAGFKFITAQGYHEWASKQAGQHTDTHITYAEAHNEAVDMAAYLQNVQIERQQEFYSKYKDDIAVDGFEAVKTAYKNKYYFPEFPVDFLSWETIPVEWQSKKGVPLTLEQSPKILGMKLAKAQAEQETFITGQLPDGFTAKIEQGSWLNPAYAIRFYTPDGQTIMNDGSQVDAQLYAQHFTDAEIEDYKQWAIDNRETYIHWMQTLAQKNPALAAALFEKTHGYTPEQSQALAGAMGAETDTLSTKIQQVTTAPQLPDGQPDNVVKMYPMPSKGEAIWSALLSMPGNQSLLDRFLTQIDVPDRVKKIVVDILPWIVPSTTGPTSILPVISWSMNVWNEAVSSSYTKLPYEAFVPETGLEKAYMEATELTYPGFLVGGAEIGLAKQGLKGLVARIAGMTMRQESKAAIRKVAEEGAEAAGIAVETAIKDGETLAKNSVIDAIAPDEIKLQPNPVEIKPGEPFDPKAKYDVVDGVNVKIDEPVMVKAEPGDPVDYVDPVTKKPYTRTDNMPPPTETAATAEKPKIPASVEKTAPAEGATVPPEPVKPQGEAPAPAPKAAPAEATQPAAMSRDEITAQVKAQYPDATPEQINAAVAAKEAKMAREVTPRDARKAELKASLSEAIQNKVLQRGAINDPASQKFYSDAVELAQIYIREGIEGIEAFAKALGGEVDDLVKKVWKEAEGIVAQHPDWTPDEAVAVSRLNRTGAKFQELSAKSDEAWHEALKFKFAEVGRIRKTMSGDEAFQAARAAERGLKEEFGLTPDDIFIDDFNRLTLIEMLQKSNKLTDAEWPNAVEALNRLFNEGRVPRPHEQKYLTDVFGNALDNMIGMHKKMGEDWYSKMLNAFGMLKSSWASFDLSYTGRQGAILAAGNPKLAAQSFATEIKALVSETKYEQAITNVREHRLYEMAKEAKVRESWGSGTKTEEAYVSDWGMKIPVMKNFNRAGLAFINELRFKKFYQTIESWERAGRNITKTEMTELASFINEATGATDLVSKFGLRGKSAQTLNALIFSPQYVTSRFAVWRHAAASPAVRKEFFTAMGAWIGATTGLVGLIAFSQKKPEQELSVFFNDLLTDPLSPEGGKLSFGGTVMDPWAGEAQVARFLVQMALGMQKDPATGNITNVGRDVILQRFARGKVAPITDLALTFMSGKDFEGKKFNPLDMQTSELKWADLAYDTLVPGAIQDIIDGFDKEGIMGALKASVSMLGVGVYTKGKTDRVSSAFYNEKKYLEEQEDKANAFLMKGDTTGAEQYAAKFPELNLTYDRSSQTYKSAEATKIRSLANGEIRKIEKKIKTIQASALSDDEKKKQVKELELEQANLMMTLLDQIKPKQGKDLVLPDITE